MSLAYKKTSLPPKRCFHSCAFLFFTQLLFTLVGSCQDASMRSEPDESQMSEEVLCMSEYAEDIHRHLRESEVRNYPNYFPLNNFFSISAFAHTTVYCLH